MLLLLFACLSFFVVVSTVPIMTLLLLLFFIFDSCIYCWCSQNNKWNQRETEHCIYLPCYCRRCRCHNIVVAVVLHCSFPILMILFLLLFATKSLCIRYHEHCFYRSTLKTAIFGLYLYVNKNYPLIVIEKISIEFCPFSWSNQKYIIYIGRPYDI